jgi:hypothetical protein
MPLRCPAQRFHAGAFRCHCGTQCPMPEAQCLMRSPGMARQAGRVKDGARRLEGVRRRWAFRERSGSGLGSEGEGREAAGLIPWWADRRNSRHKGNQRPVGAGGARTGPVLPGMIRERHLSETGLRGGWLSGVLTGRAEQDMAPAGSLSGSGGEQDSVQQRQRNHETDTTPPDVAERRHRVVVAVCGHGSSRRSREGTVK